MKLSRAQKLDSVSACSHAITWAEEAKLATRVFAYKNLRKTFEQAIAKDERESDARN